MVKRDLAEDLMKAFPGIAKKDMLTVVEIMFESMAQALMRGETVDLRGLGRLRVKKRRPMKGRNPMTAANVHVPARWVVHFKPAGSLINRING
ncbi:MAG: integration host factor subunit beta [Deltaproteobacteria bacterium]|nr:integration host factor subunit beta [Deltaproteobacteria bacterium]